VHDELHELEQFDRELDEELQDVMLDETNLLLQLEDVQLSLELSKLLEQHLKLVEEEGEL